MKFYSTLALDQVVEEPLNAGALRSVSSMW